MDADKGLLLGIIALLLILTVILVSPYIQFVLAAVVLAFVLSPLQNRLAPRIGDTLSSVALVVFSIIALLVPVFVIVGFIASDVAAFARQAEEEGLEFEVLESLLADYVGVDIDIASTVQDAGEGIGQWLFGGAITAFETTIHFLIGIGLLLFLLFFLIRDGDSLVAWMKDRSPFPQQVGDDLTGRIGDITRAVLVGHVLVAIIQGIIAGVGLVATGVPNPLFWTFVMILLALIPLIGTFAVWAPASVYLFAIGQPIAAVGLFVYGAVVVGVSDEYLRPVIVDRYAEISPSVIIVGVIGGLSVFGFMGLFLGPIVVGALKETIEVYDEHYAFETAGTDK